LTDIHSRRVGRSHGSQPVPRLEMFAGIQERLRMDFRVVRKEYTSGSDATLIEVGVG
jgi:hypothetical protein